MAIQPSQQSLPNRLTGKSSDSEKISSLYEPYIGFARDRKLSRALKTMVKGISACSHQPDIPDKRRILVVCGESGAGKTRALIEHIQRTKEMQPFIDQDGVWVDPLLYFKAPSPSTPQKFAYRGLTALGFPVNAATRENRIWDVFQSQLKANRKKYVVIDEAQDAIEAANKLELIKIANAIKDLVQMPNWPIVLILIGVAPLAEFVCRKQLYNRRIVVPFEGVTDDKIDETVSLILERVVVDHAGLRLGKDLPKDFNRRLSRANDAQIGSIVQMVRGVVECAWEEQSEVVTLKHFEEMYEAYSGCIEKENIFTSPDWKTLIPFTALLRDGDLDHVDVRAATFNTQPQDQRRRA